MQASVIPLDTAWALKNPLIIAECGLVRLGDTA
jgi:hypothetical protein